jgi:hypothetical protein
VKTCRSCKRSLSLDSFHKHPQTADARSSRCNECERAYQREYHARPGIVEKKRAYSDAWRQKHAGSMKARQRASYERHHEKRLWGAARRRAEKAGIAFDIEVSDVVIPELCPIFGTPIERGAKHSLGPGAQSPTIDRIDSTKGYVKGNVWVISWRANRIKSDATPYELETIAAAVRRML